MEIIDNKNENESGSESSRSESGSRNDNKKNNKNEIKHKKAASAKNKKEGEEEIKPIRCRCVECQETSTKRHSSKCCFLPNKLRSTPFEKSKCCDKRCDETNCELFAYELWNEVTENLVYRLIISYPGKDFTGGGYLMKVKNLLEKIAKEYPDYKIDDMLVPNWVAKNLLSTREMDNMMSIGFNYDCNDRDFFIVIAEYARREGGAYAPKGWTKKYEAINPAFATELNRKIMYAN